jgi:hypothetical protein
MLLFSPFEYIPRSWADEAGRGCLAGPAVAAVILPETALFLC